MNEDKWVRCKIFGHKIVDYRWGINICSRCGEILDWGEFEGYLQTLKSGKVLKIMTTGLIDPEDL